MLMQVSLHVWMPVWVLCVDEQVEVEQAQSTLVMRSVLPPAQADWSAIEDLDLQARALARLDVGLLTSLRCLKCVGRNSR
jgi:hypothetical protein